MGKIKAVLFDFGGVLAEEGFRNGLLELGRRQRLNPEMVSEGGRRIVHQSGYVIGRGSEGDFWRQMRQQTGLRGSDEELSAVSGGVQIFDWFIKSFEGLQVDRSRG